MMTEVKKIIRAVCGLRKDSRPARNFIAIPSVFSRKRTGSKCSTNQRVMRSATKGNMAASKKINSAPIKIAAPIIARLRISAEKAGFLGQIRKLTQVEEDKSQHHHAVKDTLNDDGGQGSRNRYTLALA